MLHYESMTDEEMNDLLLQLGSTDFYQAILRYLTQRDRIVTTALRSTSAFKNPDTVAQNQGVFMGLWDLPGAIKLLQDKAAEIENGKAGEGDDKNGK